MLYSYNKQQLQYKKIQIKHYIYSILIIGAIFSSFSFTAAVQFNNAIEKIAVVIRVNEESFNEKNLKKEINKLNFKYPSIILAQAKLESGNYKSNIFKENNNLFGLKVAKLRCTTALGENLNHSIYKNWQSSVQDRAMWEIQNCKNIHSEEEYYQLLDAMYSETDNYSQMLKQIINKN